jgi:hypothetical protein
MWSHELPHWVRYFYKWTFYGVVWGVHQVIGAECVHYAPELVVKEKQKDGLSASPETGLSNLG